MAEVELQQIGSYPVTDLLRRSSTSDFYRSKYRKKDVVIQRLNVALPTSEGKELFFTRAKQLRKLKIQTIVTIQDIGFDGDYGYLVMDHVSGETLQQKIAPGERLAPDTVKRYLSPIADALHYAHVHNTLHGNLHPGILLSDPRVTVLLSDFALTPTIVATPEQPLLHDEAFAIPYMAPEHLLGHPCPASDQYALAVMVYEWLCGRCPYDATERELLFEQQKQAPIPPLQQFNEAVSPAVAQVVTRALSLDAAERYPHAQEFARQYLWALMGIEPKPAPITPRVAAPPVVSTPTNKPDATGPQAVLTAIATRLTSGKKEASDTAETGDELTSDVDDTAVEEAVQTPQKLDLPVPGEIARTPRLPEMDEESAKKVAERPERYTAEESDIDEDEFDLPADFAFGTSRLSTIVGTDLCQGGVLSQRLPGYEERPAQVEMASLVSRAITEHVPAIIEAGTGTGKALDVETPIPTPTGWKKMGELVTGDFVFDDMGQPTRVTAAFDIMYGRPCYEVVFSDGSSLVADAEHEWITCTRSGQDWNTPSLVTTRQIADTLTISPDQQLNHAIPIAGALTLPEIELPDDPYYFGKTLIEQTSHIPPIYLRATTSQRHALLAGLLTNPATTHYENTTNFTAPNPQLAQDIYELLCSLAFQPSLQQNTITFPSQMALQRPFLVVGARFSAPAVEPSYTQHTSQTNHFRYVVSVTPVPSRPVRCIQVEAESHLYLAGRAMIPTHNSLAYLVPVVRSGQVAIVSTANKALQEQLFYKDIPFIQKHIKRFEAALVKGVNNYVCIDRVEAQRIGIQHYAKNRDFQRLYNLMEDPDANFNGDFETLGFQLPGDIRGQVATDSDMCAWSKCSYFADCYVREMRERAERAQIIVVNHTLLLLDAAIGGFLLPDRDLIVLDEAHHLEEEATRSFTITIGPSQIQSLLAQHMLKNHSQLSLQDDVTRAAQETWLQLDQVVNLGFKGRVNLEAPLEEGLRLANKLTDLADSLRKQRPKNLEEKDGQLYDKLLKRAQNLAENVRIVFSAASPDKYVYYVERAESANVRGFSLQASAAPLDVTSWLKERLFNKCNVICTSATLATVSPTPKGSEGKGGEKKESSKGANFTYFRRRIGLDPQERDDVLESILPLTFDYESNALLYLPRDLPEPTFGAGSDEYMKSIARVMYRLVKISEGRAFLLFSSKRMLDRAYELMAPHLPYPLLKQGDMTRMELTRRFRQEEGAILFGLKSFWEGVDIAGDALSLVVIDKLPFDPPDDPVHEARVAQMKAAGENWFGTYVLPQAVLRLKQGLGRLLRTREDRGVMAILDTRLHTKGYGKMVLNALPPARRTSSIRDVESFFASPTT